MGDLRGLGRLTAQEAGDYVGDAVEKEEFRNVEGFDQHSEACCNNGGQSDYVYDADDLEDDVTWACQGFLEERHCYRKIGIGTEIVGRGLELGGTNMLDRK